MSFDTVTKPGPAVPMDWLPDMIVHFSLVAHEDVVSWPQPDEDALCCKMTGVPPAKSKFDNPWYSDDKSLISCQECLEWMHA